MTIRRATPADADAICAIWNPVIRDSVATFNSIEKSPNDIVQMCLGKPTLVTEQAGQIIGFVTYGQFRGGIGYAHTAEHTIHLAPAARGQGAGRALMDAICEHACTAGIHSMWAGISAENSAGVAFHARLGFDHIARLPEVGQKFGRWHDLILMQKRL